MAKIEHGKLCPLIGEDCRGLECAWYTKIAGTNPIKVLMRAVKTNEIIISLIFIGAINKLVKFLLQISSKNNMLKLILDLNKKS